MKTYQSRSFEQSVKKLNQDQKKILDEQIKIIIADPENGVEKKGDLKEVFVYKFKIKTVQYLLAYRFNDKAIELLMLGPHQNYYHDLKKYLKNK